MPSYPLVAQQRAEVSSAGPGACTLRTPESKRPPTILSPAVPHFRRQMKPSKYQAPPPKWVIDLSGSPATARPASKIPDPPGFGSRGGSGNKVLPSLPRLSMQPANQFTLQKATTPAKPPPTQAETDDLYLKKAWEVVLAAAKQLPMNFIMMYMSGNTLQIFSIMMVWMLFQNPLRALANTGSTFRRFDNERTHGRLWAVKLVFVLCQLLCLGVGVWKVNGMGLLPNRRSDWLAWEAVRGARETVVAGGGWS